MASNKKPLSDWINLNTIRITANVFLFLVIAYLFLNYYGMLSTHFPFLEHNMFIFGGWIYLSINIVAVNFFDWIQKTRAKKSCPHCNDSLMVHKYKCCGCDREI